MARDILIIPQASASIYFSGSYSASILLKVEDSGSLNFMGKSGSLFSIEDQLSGSLMSVGDISGIPIFEVFSDNSVNIGRFNGYAVAVQPGGIDVQLGSGSAMLVSASKNVYVSGSISASRFLGTASFADTSSWAINAGTTLTTASFYPVTVSFSTNALSASTVFTVTASTNRNFAIPFVSSSNTTSYQQLYVDSGSMLLYNPATDTLTVSTASGFLFGTASWAQSASMSLLSNQAYSASWTNFAADSAFSETSDFALDSLFCMTASYAKTASVFVLFSSSFTSQSVSSSNADTASVALHAYQADTASYLLPVNVLVSNAYQITTASFNTYTASFTASAADDGKLIIVNSGSLVTILLTSSLSPSFNAMFIQYGSGSFAFTGSQVALRNKNSQVSSSIQYGTVTAVRLPTGDFLINGDTQ